MRNTSGLQPLQSKETFLPPGKLKVKTRVELHVSHDLWIKGQLLSLVNLYCRKRVVIFKGSTFYPHV